MFSPSSSASEAGFLPYREVHAHPCTRLLVATLTVLETAAVVPTLWLEQRLGHANHAVEQIVLRVALMLLRLYPILEGAIDLLVLLCFQSVHGHVAISLPVEMQTMVSNVSK